MASNQSASATHQEADNHVINLPLPPAPTPAAIPPVPPPYPQLQAMHAPAHKLPQPPAALAPAPGPAPLMLPPRAAPAATPPPPPGAPLAPPAPPTQLPLINGAPNASLAIPGDTMSSGKQHAANGEGRMKFRVWTWLLALGVWASFLGLMISIGRYRAVQAKIKEDEKDRASYYYSDIDDSQQFIALTLFSVIFGMFYLYYIKTCWSCGTRIFVANIDRETNVQQYIQRLREQPPVVTFHAECYHMETFTRQVPEQITGPDGKSMTSYRTESYKETVVTHRAQEDYGIASWVDGTPPVIGLGVVSLTKLHLRKDLTFLNENARMQHDAAYRSFCSLNNSDVSQDFWTVLTVQGFKERVLCFADVTSAPWWVGSFGYWLASVLMLNVVYRAVLDWRTTILRHAVVKQIE